MKSVRAALLIVLLALALTGSACGPDGLVSRLNLLGQERFTVGDQTYGLEQVVYTSSEVELAFVRAVPSGQIDQSDADAIAAVAGIELVDADGGRVPVREVIARPQEHESGLVVLIFDVSGHPEPWMLEWPGHEPYSIN